MSLWSKLFGSKPKTIDDEILEAGLALGRKKADIKESTERAIRIGMTKDDVLTAYRDEIVKQARKKN